MNPTFSVIVPTYNGLLYLDKALESVFAQEYPPKEIIVIDDGSTDATPQALAKYGNRVITKRIKQSGSSGARNAGIKIATGDHLAFLDSDDVWFKNRLSITAEFIQKYPDVGVFVSNYAVRHRHLKGRMSKHYSTLDPKTRHRMCFNEPLHVLPLELLLDGNFVGTCSAFVVKKAVLDRTGTFKEGLSHVEDLELLFRLAVETDFLVSDQVTLYKRTHSDNLSGDFLSTHYFHREILVDLLASSDKRKAYIEAHRLRGKVRKAIAQLCYDLGNDHYNAGRVKETLKLYIQGLRYSPSPSNAGKFLWKFSKKILRFCQSKLV